MSDVSRTILEAIKSELANELTGYRPLAYTLDPSRNSYRQVPNSYGVRPGSTSQVSGVMGSITYIQTFELVVLAPLGNDTVNDSAAVSNSLDLMSVVKRSHSRLLRTKCGAPSEVMNVSNLSIQDPQTDLNEKTITVRATLDVTYRIRN